MEMNVKFESIAEILEFAKLFGNPENCISQCKEVCKEVCQETCNMKYSEDAEDPAVKKEIVADEKPKPKRKRATKKKEDLKVVEKAEVEPELEDNQQPTPEVEKEEPKEVPTLNNEKIVETQPEVNENPVDVSEAPAPALFNTVMSVNEYVRGMMMDGTIERDALMKIATKLPEVNSAIFNKFSASTTADEAQVREEIKTLVNSGEILNLL